MYDFWFTLGSGIIDPPGLIKALKDAEFYFCPRLTIMVEKKGPKLLNGPSTGELDITATPKVRLAISNFLRSASKPAPPVGVYTAGRFCQLKKIPRFQKSNKKSTLRDILDLCNSAYQYAIKGGASKLPAFPAFLGLCLLDGNIVAAIVKYPQGAKGPQDEMLEIACEFGISPKTRDWDIVVAFAKSGDFQRAQNLFMVGDRNPWAKTGTTLEQATFSKDKTEYAIP